MSLHDFQVIWAFLTQIFLVSLFEKFWGQKVFFLWFLYKIIILVKFDTKMDSVSHCHFQLHPINKRYLFAEVLLITKSSVVKQNGKMFINYSLLNW